MYTHQVHNFSRFFKYMYHSFQTFVEVTTFIRLFFVRCWKDAQRRNRNWKRRPQTSHTMLWLQVLRAQGTLRELKEDYSESKRYLPHVRYRRMKKMIERVIEKRELLQLDWKNNSNMMTFLLYTYFVLTTFFFFIKVLRIFFLKSISIEIFWLIVK